MFSLLVAHSIRIVDYKTRLTLDLVCLHVVSQSKFEDKESILSSRYCGRESMLGVCEVPHFTLV